MSNIDLSLHSSSEYTRLLGLLLVVDEGLDICLDGDKVLACDERSVEYQERSDDFRITALQVATSDTVRGIISPPFSQPPAVSSEQSEHMAYLTQVFEVMPDSSSKSISLLLTQPLNLTE